MAMAGKAMNALRPNTFRSLDSRPQPPSRREQQPVRQHLGQEERKSSRDQEELEPLDPSLAELTPKVLVLEGIYFVEQAAQCARIVALKYRPPPASAIRCRAPSSEPGQDWPALTILPVSDHILLLIVDRYRHSLRRAETDRVDDRSFRCGLPGGFDRVPPRGSLRPS